MQLVLDVTSYGNKPDSSKWLVRGGYVSTAAVGAVETVAALASYTFSITLYPVSATPLERSATWLHDSVWSVAWSAINIVSSF